MGAGNSREYYGGNRLSAPNYARGKRRRRRGTVRQVQPTVTTEPLPPVKYRSPHHYHHGSSHHYHHGLQPLAYPRMPVPAQISYPGHMPMLYNNYAMSPYAFSRQPYMMPAQRYQPMVMPQSPPMSMFQQASSPLYSAYPSAPYSTGVPMSPPYVPQPTPVPFNYNNMGSSAPVPMSMPSSATPYPSARPMTVGKLSTDWTGGGKISPGFLGPPI